MKIIFLGAPGCGKGTQARKLSEKYSIKTLSTGDLLRSEIKNNSNIGIEAKKYIEQGNLVPDQVINNIVAINIINLDSFILDGYPRTIEQAINLNNILLANNKKIDCVIYFTASDDVLIKRICGRFSCKNCNAIYNKYFKKTKKDNICDQCGSTDFEIRQDDNEETIKHRLQVFKDQNDKLINYYQKNNLIYSLDALKNEGFIFENLVSYLDKLN
jgi:adenylate kinase